METNMIQPSRLQGMRKTNNIRLINSVTFCSSYCRRRDKSSTAAQTYIRAGTGIKGGGVPEKLRSPSFFFASGITTESSRSTKPFGDNRQNTFNFHYY